MSNYVVVSQSLPRSLDVQVSLSRPQAETRTNLSVLCVVGTDLGFLPDANRIRYYSLLSQVEADFSTTSQVYMAAQTFFAQSPRANIMAIGEVFLTNQPARLVSTVITSTDIYNITQIDAGAMKIVYNPGDGEVTQHFTGMDFTGVTTLAGIIDVIQAHAGSGLHAVARALPGGGNRIEIHTVATGNSTTIAFAAAEGAGTEMASMMHLTSATGAVKFAGYAPEGIAGELSNIAAAASANGTYVYGYALAAELRDVTYQVPAAAWALGNVVVMGLVTNDPSALDPANTADLGKVVHTTGNRRVHCFYHDDPAQYPEVSLLAYMFSVNYRIQDSTVTAKFKQLPGITTVQLTLPQWLVLENKGYNTYTLIGNSSRTVREGVTEDPSYFLDDLINLDNFVEDLSVAVFNVFLQHKKVPYTSRGQLMLVDACMDVGNQYVYNGTFADRLITDLASKSGVRTVPAVQVIPSPIQDASVADRASRIGPPIDILVQMAGSIHSVAIAVEVVS